MATGFSRTIEGGHDVIYDYCCTTCDRQNLNADSSFYCKDCKKLFCDACKQYHEKFTEGHRVLGKKEVAKWGDVKPVTSSIMCDEHPGKELEMFCRDHDRVCCSVCMHIKHRGCREVKPVASVAKGIQKSSEFKTLLLDTAKTKASLKIQCDKKEDNIKMLEKARGEIKSTLKTMRKKFKEIIDRLEEDSIAEMDRLIAMLKEHASLDKAACSAFIDKIHKLLDDIQTLGKQCDDLAFQGYKKCSEQKINAENLISSIQDVDYKLQFTPDAKIEQYLSSLETFGSFHVTPSKLVDRLENKELSKPLTSSDHIYSVMNKQTYNVRTSGDTKACFISDMCQLPDGQTAIVDCDNTNMKLLSASKYTVLSVQKMPPVPWGICHTTGTELAVTVWDKKDRHEIQFFNAGKGKLSYTRTVKLDHGCFCIAYRNSQLHVGSINALYVYNLSGKMWKKTKKLYEGTSGQYPTVCKFSISDDGSRIYVANNNNHLLLILDSSGQQLTELSEPEFKKIRGVCVADNGSVFVCGGSYQSILQLDREGRKMNTLFTRADGDAEPQSLYYNRKTQTLLVGQRNDDNLLVLQLR